MRHQLSLLSTTRSSLLASSPRHVQHHVLPSTEATGLRLVSFLHGSDWSRTTSCGHRQDTFLVSHGIIPECLLHSNRQMNRVPRLSGQNSDFSCGTSLEHIPSLMFSSVKRALCDGFHSHFIITCVQLRSNELCVMISQHFINQLNQMGNAPCLSENGNYLITNLSTLSQTFPH